MSSIDLPQHQWDEFLQSFTKRHRGWLVTLEMHDVETGEDVTSRSTPLKSIEFDLEDEKHPRINVTVQSDDKEIKHIFFMPSRLVLYLSDQRTDEALRIESVNISTLVRLRVATKPERVNEVA